ncbi:uncharacterized protein SAPINGB_P004815 [Magnusiomyces paraingens]|uniref:Thioredoxin domain-containing protein n=1 Tax=Magnusiomyces paraingens TaxID=2606893 RepID=A0A5E8BXC9_9ASCO|nr:uncharacterized protein SAPINGB_P004815 [Saprochaete ingens]VVT56104.1 unnamed protein product [Saprochaete ingens]
MTFQKLSSQKEVDDFTASGNAIVYYFRRSSQVPITQFIVPFKEELPPEFPSIKFASFDQVFDSEFCASKTGPNIGAAYFFKDGTQIARQNGVISKDSFHELIQKYF